MKLFYKPGACSMASHIALIEAGASFAIEAVDTTVGRTDSGADFRQINSKGYVPALQFETGEVLTEGPAILQFIADSHGAAALAPAVGTLARGRMLERLTFTSSELHKAFGPLFRDGASDVEKDKAREAVAGKFDVIEADLADHPEKGGFDIADAYLFVVPNWANFTGIDLDRWPNLARFVGKMAQRASVQAAMRAEGLLA